MREQRQNGWMQRIVQVGDRVVRAVDRQRVLDEIVRPDRQEIELAREYAERKGGRRHLYHPANLDLPVIGYFLRIEAALCLRDEHECLLDLASAGEHRDQDV